MMRCEIRIKAIHSFSYKIKPNINYFPSCSLTSFNDRRANGLYMPLSGPLSSFCDTVLSSSSKQRLLYFSGSYSLDHHYRFSQEFYLLTIFFLFSAIYPLMISSTTPAQTALLVINCPNLHTQLQLLPHVPSSCFHCLYITSLFYVPLASGRALPSARHPASNLGLLNSHIQSPSPAPSGLTPFLLTWLLVTLLQALALPKGSFPNHALSLSFYSG